MKAKLRMADGKKLTKNDFYYMPVQRDFEHYNGVDHSEVMNKASREMKKPYGR